MNSKLGYFEGSHKNNNVYAFLQKHVQNFPDRAILKWSSREQIVQWSQNPAGPLTFTEISVSGLYHAVNKAAVGLSKLGIGHGDRVILFLPMSVPLYTTMFALQKIGAIPTFLDSWARRDQLGVSAEVVSPKAMISFEKAFDLCSGAKVFDEIPVKVVLGPHEKEYQGTVEGFQGIEGDVPVQAVEREHTALITFTTGSSGTPKGANRTHRFLAAQHYALHKNLPYTEKDVDLPVFPIFSLNNLAEGVATVIPGFDVGTPSDMDPLVLLAQFKACGVTCTTLSPSLLNRLSAYCLEKKIQIPELKRIVTGGAPVSRDNVIDIKKVAPNAEIHILYGSTEVEPIAHIQDEEMINRPSASDQDPELEDEGVNVGTLDSGLTFKFIKIDKGTVSVSSDASWANIEVSKGEVGELIVAGEHVCREYYNNTEAFSRAKILDHNNVVWHRTGDLGKVDDSNQLWLVGRVHNAINRGGDYCYPVRAEVVLKKLPFVKYCAYLGMPDDKLGEKVYAVYSSKDELESSPSNIEEWNQEVRRILDKNKIVVDKILFFEEIPLDSRHHSKVEYAVLRKNLLEKGLG